MRREIESYLVEWKRDPRRLPLLLRGARQVGKTYVLEKFGREHFANVVVVNFEFQPNVETCFADLDPKVILSRLEVFLKAEIEIGKTLLVFDEIQACPKAILALRYFKEKLPEMHVIGAGSLLEFALEEERFSFPVGRVKFIYLGPLSFCEFLEAIGEERILTAEEEIIHDKALELVHLYFLLGGMPAVIDEYVQSSSIRKAREMQGVILDTYRNDFGKYARKAQYKYLQRVFERAPQLACRHFQYRKVDPDMRSRELGLALEQLVHAGLIRQIYATKANGLPLRAEVNFRKFKLLFLDIGLLQAANQVDPETVLQEDLIAINSGQLAEQFVGQELLAYASPYEERHLFFWERGREGGSAEVDFVVRIDSQIVPIEVKAGSTGRLRSLKQMMQAKDLPVGLRISERRVERDEQIVSVPFYSISKIPTILQ